MMDRKFMDKFNIMCNLVTQQGGKLRKPFVIKEIFWEKIWPQ